MFEFFSEFTITTDIIIAFFVVLFSIIIMYWKRSVAAALVLSFYPSTLLFTFVPDYLLDLAKSNELIVYLVIYIICFLIVTSVLGDFFSKQLEGSLFEGILLGVTLIILLLVFLFHFVSIGDVVISENKIIDLISNNNYIFYALLVPLILFYFVFAI